MFTIPKTIQINLIPIVAAYITFKMNRMTVKEGKTAHYLGCFPFWPLDPFRSNREGSGFVKMHSKLYISHQLLQGLMGAFRGMCLASEVPWQCSEFVQDTIFHCFVHELRPLRFSSQTYRLSYRRIEIPFNKHVLVPPPISYLSYLCMYGTSFVWSGQVIICSVNKETPGSDAQTNFPDQHIFQKGKWTIPNHT